jgi:hypothetical protein
MLHGLADDLTYLDISQDLPTLGYEGAFFSSECHQYVKLPAIQYIIPEDQNLQHVNYKELKINTRN